MLYDHFDKDLSGCDRVTGYEAKSAFHYMIGKRTPKYNITFKGDGLTEVNTYGFDGFWIEERKDNEGRLKRRRKVIMTSVGAPFATGIENYDDDDALHGDYRREVDPPEDNDGWSCFEKGTYDHGRKIGEWEIRQNSMKGPVLRSLIQYGANGMAYEVTCDKAGTPESLKVIDGKRSVTFAPNEMHFSHCVPSDQVQVPVITYMQEVQILKKQKVRDCANQGIANFETWRENYIEVRDRTRQDEERDLDKLDLFYANVLQIIPKEFLPEGIVVPVLKDRKPS